MFSIVILNEREHLVCLSVVGNGCFTLFRMTFFLKAAGRVAVCHKKEEPFVLEKWRKEHIFVCTELKMNS